MTFFGNFQQTKNVPVLIQTLGSSVCAGLFRIGLVPVDTLKTILQVEGKNAMNILTNNYNQGGIRVFYHGALASAGATMMGHCLLHIIIIILMKHYLNIPKDQRN